MFANLGCLYNIIQQKFIAGNFFALRRNICNFCPLKIHGSKGCCALGDGSVEQACEGLPYKFILSYSFVNFAIWNANLKLAQIDRETTPTPPLQQ